MKKILITGAKGMLGHDIVNALKEDRKFEVVGVDKDELDITDISQIRTFLNQSSPDMVINCAAYTDVDGAEDNKDLAYRVNAYGVEYLARVTKELDIPLLQLSTNYVFDGTKETPYTEDELIQPQPLGVYGTSKYRGEVLLKQFNDKHYIIRTSNLFGGHGKNFIQAIVKHAQVKPQLPVVADQIGNPTFSEHLAKAIYQLIQDEPEYGIYHLTNTTPAGAGISWYTFAKKIVEYRGYSTKVIRVTSQEYPTKAERPKQGTLLNTKRPPLPSYQEALLEYLSKF